MRNRKFLFLIILMFAISCNQTPRIGNLALSSKNSNSTPNSSGDGKNAFDNSTSSDSNIFANGKPEIRHLIDPFDGTYKTKLTIPKNYKGYFYVSGLNITSLKDKLVKVRFNFGREMEAITVQATVGRAPGLTPQTDIEVLILDLSSQPFNNIRLLYDLYDYTSNTEPTTEARSQDLYCRGLKLEHDPTFEGSATNTACDTAGETCSYAYANIKDAGLYYDYTGSGDYVSFIPSEAQLDLGTKGYDLDSLTNLLKKCLPDTNTFGDINAVLTVDNSTGSASENPTLVADPSYGDTFTFTGNATSYVYRGPFRPIGTSTWEISAGAIIDPNGIFETALPGTTLTGYGYGSHLFPRAGKMNLKSNIEFFDNLTTPYGVKSKRSGGLLSSGDTGWMDGCNIRVSNYDSYTNEGISSCSVSATIEVITNDLSTGAEVILATSTEVKLQLIRPSLTNYQGNEVLYTSLKTCSTSNACGSSECCYNNRCWSNDLVTQCLEDASAVGNLGVGQTCSSDYQCSSLCCNQSTGLCAVHDNTIDPPVLCSKAPGQQCVAKEWCRIENVSECKIIRTGTDTSGREICALRCYNIPQNGQCRSGVCIPPDVPTVPVFDPSNPYCDQYSGVENPPTI